MAKCTANQGPVRSTQKGTGEAEEELPSGAAPALPEQLCYLHGLTQLGSQGKGLVRDHDVSHTSSLRTTGCNHCTVSPKPKPGRLKFHSRSQRDRVFLHFRPPGCLGSRFKMDPFLKPADGLSVPMMSCGPCHPPPPPRPGGPYSAWRAPGRRRCSVSSVPGY